MSAIQKIPASFQKGEFTMKMLCRTGNIAIFSKRNPKHSRPSFEVVLIQEKPEEVLFGKLLPARESLPGSEQWGLRGWTYSNAADATRKFDSLVKFQSQTERTANAS